ncbi:exodeoxyribonuclease VII large subunit [Candidatus Saccharibacteria bacterium]|nr:exodeoxyribonuclease VII large subunit [Candidatus Saccharibacteria bacterium]
MPESLTMSPTEFVAVVNQTLEYAYSSVLITGEVASYKVNQGKWVFFDLKDEETSISCFMPLWSLRVPLEDGMKVVARGVPKLTKWGKFSLTVNAIKPVGEGSLKRAYEMLKKKLAAEGLFDPAKKRSLPADLTRLGVISSTGAAGYADFIKIINARWGGMRVQVAHTQVQGMDAPEQMIRALKYFNERSEVQVIAMLRGGGSADDLSCFNDEALVREIAASRIPVITGIGHEVDESLADLAADVRASTPSNAAEMLTKDRNEERAKLARAMSRATHSVLTEVERARQLNREKVENVSRGLLTKYVEPAIMRNRQAVERVGQSLISRYIDPMLVANREKMSKALTKLQNECDRLAMDLRHKQQMLEVLKPEKVLSQGYAILAGKISPGNVVKITTIDQEIEAEIKKVNNRKE